MNKLLLSAGCAAVVTLTAPPVQAQDSGGDWRDKLDFDGKITFQYVYEDNPDLGVDTSDEDSLSEQLQLRAGYPFTPDIYGLIYGRALNIEGESGFDDDTGEETALDTAFVELRQAWLRFENLAGQGPLSLIAGRQRFREPRALWWNSDFDAVRLAWETTMLEAFVAAGEELTSWRTSVDDDFEEEDKDRFRALGAVSWQYRYNHFLEARSVYEYDHSGLETIGSLVDADDRDDEDLHAAWVGARSAGTWTPDAEEIRFLSYRLDVIGLAGEVDNLATTGVTSEVRQVTGHDTDDLRAWALDAGIVLAPAITGDIVFIANYAYGSGDDDPNDDTDNAFRQTDLEGNRSRIGLERQQVRNYGEVLRPELSNIHIASAGIAVPWTKNIESSLTYFYYRLDEDTTRLRSSGISANLNGNDKSLGQAVDLATYINLFDQFDVEVPFFERADFRFVIGSFFPGDAWDVAGADTEDSTYRLYTQLNFRF